MCVGGYRLKKKVCPVKTFRINYFSLYHHGDTSSDVTSCFPSCSHLGTADAQWSLFSSAQCSYVRIITETPLGAGVVLKTVFTAFSCVPPPPSPQSKQCRFETRRTRKLSVLLILFFYTYKNTQVFLSRQKSDRWASDVPEGYSTFKEWTFSYYKAVRDSALYFV